MKTAAGRDLITVALYKTDREYLAELGRRAHGRPVLLGAFAENVRMFEEAWYGTREVSPETIGRFRANHDEVKRHAD